MTSLDNYANEYCEWCNKSCIHSEVSYGNDTQGNTTRLCSFCIKFPRIDVMKLWQVTIKNFAVVDKEVKISSIEYINGDYMIHYTYKDNDMVRSGWVA